MVSLKTVSGDGFTFYANVMSRTLRQIMQPVRLLSLSFLSQLKHF